MGVRGAGAGSSNLEDPGGVELPDVSATLACGFSASQTGPTLTEAMAAPGITCGRDRSGDNEGDRPMAAASDCVTRCCGVYCRGLVHELPPTVPVDRRERSMLCRTWDPVAVVPPVVARASSRAFISERTSSSSLSKERFWLASCSRRASHSACNWAREATLRLASAIWPCVTSRAASRAWRVSAFSRRASLVASDCFSTSCLAAASSCSQSRLFASAAPVRASAALSRWWSAWSSWLDSLFSL
mmetsp:Transcript_86059/g.238430  ORF Transcript_86059/g.238430 Transcript_86059/m.238430 type:complete len:244 (-) Transcript_86059:995-1726(-)